MKMSEDSGIGDDVPRPFRVFVHLARNKDVAEWSAAYKAGTLVGVNDETPYGYGRAEHMGCKVRFSTSRAEGLIGKVIRLSLRVAMGFDYLHALHQRDAMLESDVVWTHTESQFLAVVAVLGATPKKPRLIGQAVWLFDKWHRMPAVQRAFFRRLVSRVDIITTHSTENARVARELFPGKRVEVVPFGIPSEEPLPPMTRAGRCVRVLAVGNDRHRDWKTLVAALGGIDGVVLEILSGTASKRLTRGFSNVVISSATTNAELRSAYARAMVVAVPLLPNLHASGITVIQEAVLAGVPVVASDVGGLRSYFEDGTVRYVAPGDALALRDAILKLSRDVDGARSMAERAQARMVASAMGAESYIGRHVELTAELLNRAP